MRVSNELGKLQKEMQFSVLKLEEKCGRDTLWLPTEGKLLDFGWRRYILVSKGYTIR